MILEYHRPGTLAEALGLLQRAYPKTVALGGGTYLSSPLFTEPVAVVDLQDLGLDQVEQRGSQVTLGAAARLEKIRTLDILPQGLREAVWHEATANLRNMATLAGTLITATGRSPLAAVLMALDAQIRLQPGDQDVSLADLLNARQETLLHKLVTSISFPTRVAVSYQYTARTPADLPIISLAVARWQSGRLRIVVGGFGVVPRLALDAPEPGGAEYALESALAEAGDEWASAAYRQDAARTLLSRALSTLITE